MVNGSVDVSGVHDTTLWRDFHQSIAGVSQTHGLHNTSTANPSTHKASGTTEDTVLLEVLIPVYIKLEDREEVCRNLGIFVQTGRGGSNGLSRKVTVRLTDPTDAFFLFELELLEDDYGSFKQRLELLVDFSGFPRYLVSMLNSIVSGVTPYAVCFVVDSRDTLRGTLRVLERTDFRTVEHISLVLMRQGDAGQKRYLAERFQHFERLYLKLTEERRIESSKALANIDELKSELASLAEERSRLRDELQQEVSRSEKNQLASTSQLREEHTTQLLQLRTSLEAELRLVTRKAEDVQKQLLDDVRLKDKNLQEARQRVLSLESNHLSLQSQLRIAEDRCNAQAKELEGLRSSNEELHNFRQQALRTMTDSDLTSVKLQERQRSLIEALKSRDEDLKTTRQQYEKQDQYIRILTSQNEQMTDQSKKLESSLAKSHHIIAVQLRHIKGAKERERMMGNQLRSQDALLQERMNTINRLGDEVGSLTERIQSLQSKVVELRDQLSKTDTVREKLTQELKQSQDALIHLQRSTSVNGRHWSVLGGPSSTGLAGLSSSCGSNPVSLDVYREFNRNASTTLRGAGWTAGPSFGNTEPVSTAAGSWANQTVYNNSNNNKNINNNNSGAGGEDDVSGAGVGGTGSTPRASSIPRQEAAFAMNSQPPGKHSHHNVVSAYHVMVPVSGSKGVVNSNGSAMGSPMMKGRQPLDPTSINVMNQTQQTLASKSFFSDPPIRADMSGNTTSLGKPQAPSAYF